LKAGHIQTENLGKYYLIGHEKRNPHSTLTDRIFQTAAQIRTKSRHLLFGGDLIAGNELETFWALRNVSFTVEPGESVGIIGRNGAGKSTLLKLLSRITDPSEGRARIGGRFASLLEVGTGFHPELSGRENIFLNGAILGMKRQEVRHKFDEIVDFSGVEQFLDTPVKRYSSGMYVRLAFAIAAHMDPDILIVDEVLAVGDSEFQKKCLGKMKDASQNQGRTILFVSHQMPSVSSLTSRCLYLEKGEVAFMGSTAEAISRYLTQGITDSLMYREETIKPGSRINAITITTSEGGYTHPFGDALSIDVEVHLATPLHQGGLTLLFTNSADIPVVQFAVSETEQPVLGMEGTFHFCCSIPKLRLSPGKYSVSAILSDHLYRNKIHWLDQVCSFEVAMIHSGTQHFPEEESFVYAEEFSWKFIA
jgi:lipopolysaccharide transport system ATP-binding protein